MGAPTPPDAMAEFLHQGGVQVASGDRRRLGVSALGFDEFLVAHFVSSPLSLRWIREDQDLRRRYVFLFVSRGRVELSGENERYEAPEGGISVIMPGSGPVELAAPQSAEGVLFSFDATEVLPVALRAESMRPVSPQSPLFRACYACLRGIVDGDATGLDEDTEVIRSLMRAVAHAMVATAGRSTQGGSVLERARDIIEREFANPRLTPDWIALRLGVSRSTLGRAFTAQGLKIAGEVRKVRADKAVERLQADPGASARTLAEESGFGSVASLSRALSEFHSVSFHDVRRGARAA
ncbi:MULTISPECIES: AraC family transcriptional regulator [Arthrobacter]|uniref:AraC family transcriptional regulator n=2 Tax=Arthrobacter TaxID=1663 RepID=A0ABU9KLK2_9MICC|nr:AraC family transcriptional regulator [Arthrobacter sp. YJM1]MDP5226571.1 AraC family transcriptional regulator [Arthrobacter sp. YJM1]